MEHLQNYEVTYKFKGFVGIRTTHYLNSTRATIERIMNNSNCEIISIKAE